MIAWLASYDTRDTQGYHLYVDENFPQVLLQILWLIIRSRPDWIPGPAPNPGPAPISGPRGPKNGVAR